MDVVRGGLHRVQRVRGHDLAFQVDLVQHHRGHRHLVRLLADLSLRGDHRGGGVRADQGREQPDLVPVSVFRAPDRLAVQPDLHQRPATRHAVIRPARCGRGEPGHVHQPGTYSGVEHLRVGVGEHPPDRRFRRRPGRNGTGPQVQIRENSSGHVSDPSGDGRIALHPGNDRRRGQRQNSGRGMIPALTRSPIRHPARHPAEQFQQATAHIQDRNRHRRHRVGRTGETLNHDEAPEA